MADDRDISLLLARWGEGDREAFAALVPLVYDELKNLAEYYLRQERSDHTLQPTALVHEAYLRLSGLRELRLHNRAHFYGAAASVMRRVLVDYARQRAAAKRKGGSANSSFVDAAPDNRIDLTLDLVALDAALDSLAELAPMRAQVVELRYFGGLSVEETAQHLGVAPATVKRHWAFARAWLFRAMTVGKPASQQPSM